MDDQISASVTRPCTECGESYSDDDLVEIQQQRVCYNCKPIFLQKIKEGAASFQKPGRSAGWKVLFFIILSLQLLSYLLIIFDFLSGKEIEIKFLITSILDICIYPWILIAIFGYAFNKKILIRPVWKILFPVALLFDIIENTIYFARYFSPKIIIAFVILILPISIFQYIALYRYGYSKIEPWV